MKNKFCSWYGCAILLAACSKQTPAPQSQAPDASLSATVTLSGTAALDAQTVLELSLTDVSGEDSAVEVAKKSFKPTQFPAEFSLPYDSSAIKAQHRYTISARLLEGAQPQWATDTAYPVITLGNPVRIDIQLVRSGANTESAIPIDDAKSSIEGELRGTEGMATYRAYFQNSQSLRIEENQNKRRASYEYTGARLRRYSSEDNAKRVLELQFDERGKLLNAAQQDNGRPMAVDASAVDAARNRAALLRSHALATQEIQEHERAATQLNATQR